MGTDGAEAGLFLYDSGACRFGMGYLITDMVGIFWGMMAALIGFTMPLAVLHLSILRRQNVFASQVVAALTLWSSSLSAGFSVLQSIELVGKESPPLWVMNSSVWLQR